MGLHPSSRSTSKTTDRGKIPCCPVLRFVPEHQWSSHSRSTLTGSPISSKISSECLGTNECVTRCVGCTCSDAVQDETPELSSSLIATNPRVQIQIRSKKTPSKRTNFSDCRSDHRWTPSFYCSASKHPFRNRSGGLELASPHSGLLLRALSLKDERSFCY